MRYATRVSNCVTVKITIRAESTLDVLDPGSLYHGAGIS
jgi:hypothetical protein